MRTKALKILVIAIAFFIVLVLSNWISGGKGKLNPILAVALIAFIGAVWKWDPKQNENNQDKHILKKD